LAIEKNSKYKFEEENSQLKIALFNNGKINKVIDCQYEVLNDTLKILEKFENGKINTEVYRIQELDLNKLKLFELSTQDVIIFNRKED